MPNTVVFLWISAAAIAAPAHSALGDLRDFGAARGLAFVAASAGRPLGLPAYDPSLADRLEAELEQARTALSALEESAARERLSRVQAELLAHPHLPQAAFLMGECLALEAQAARELEPAVALDLDARRLALEGPRAPAFGDAASVAPTAATTTFEVQGLDADDQLELDGAAAWGTERHVSLLPGLHHVRVWRGGRPIFATFVETAPEPGVLTLTPPRATPCSVEDLQGDAEARRRPEHGGVACERWAKVREERHGVGVALCEHDHCGAFVHWQRRQPTPFAPIAIDRQRFPSWAGFALAGAGVIVASSLVLWQAGVFERGGATTATWHYGGLDPQAIRF